ncbi:MAG: hypothetical protein ACPHJ3_14020, partial [Rubripirellula sp.]
CLAHPIGEGAIEEHGDHAAGVGDFLLDACRNAVENACNRCLNAGSTELSSFSTVQRSASSNGMCDFHTPAEGFVRNWHCIDRPHCRYDQSPFQMMLSLW